MVTEEVPLKKPKSRAVAEEEEEEEEEVEEEDVTTSLLLFCARDKPAASSKMKEPVRQQTSTRSCQSPPKPYQF